MGERGSRKIPVTERQFLWVQDDDKGEVILHVGPTMVSPTAADRVVVDDGQGGFQPGTGPQPEMRPHSGHMNGNGYNGHGGQRADGEAGDGQQQGSGQRFDRQGRGARGMPGRPAAVVHEPADEHRRQPVPRVERGHQLEHGGVRLDAVVPPVPPPCFGSRPAGP